MVLVSYFLSPSLSGFRKDDPSLALRDRAAFLDLNQITSLAAVFLVMCDIFLRAPNKFLIERMLKLALHPNDDGLVRRIAYDSSMEGAFRHPSPPSSVPLHSGLS